MGLLGPEAISRPPQEGAERRRRKIVRERQTRVRLEWEPPVRGHDEHAARHPEHLRHERALAVTVTDVLDHRVAERDVEFPITERQPRAGPHADEADARVLTLQMRPVLRADARDPILEGVQALEKIRLRKPRVARDTNVEDALVASRRAHGEEQPIDADP